MIIDVYMHLIDTVKVIGVLLIITEIVKIGLSAIVEIYKGS